MEVFRHRVGRERGYVVRQSRVERGDQAGDAQPPGEPKVYDLAEGMCPGVGPASADYPDLLPAQLVQGPPQLALYSSAPGLQLESGEARPVVFEHDLCIHF
jgi:hypothetical protein